MKVTKYIFALSLFISLTANVFAIESEPDWKYRFNQLVDEAISNTSPPNPGQQVTLVRRIGGNISGKLVTITTNNITIHTFSGDETFLKKDITPDCVLQLFIHDAARAKALAQVKLEKADYDQRKSTEELNRKREIERIALQKKQAEEKAQAEIQAIQRQKQERAELFMMILKGVLAFVFFFACVALYFLPAITAHKRHHHNTLAILTLNLFLGWSFIGWVISLVWAYTESEKK